MAWAGARASRLLFTGVGALGGASAALLWKPQQTEQQQQPLSSGQRISFSTLSLYSDGIAQPRTVWDPNWDRRDPAATVPRPEGKSPEELRTDAEYQEALARAKPRARRHLVLIRHGQYNLDGATDEQRTLTELGRRQAELAGQQLARLGLTYTALVQSTMTRALETAQIVRQHLPDTLPVHTSDLLREGAPHLPEPYSRHWKPQPRRFYEDGARIEAAFRRFVHRASPEQQEDSVELFVCHANVIRYFVCRALQLPPEAWLRFSLRHASLTWITIMPNGRVKLDFLGDAGFMPTEAMTFS